ncbi:STAS domain-containing protein [Pseudalkalibacillus hwajinpoensis]|uniref:STAS domain-containing protein n=1 Tax=Guptibacillus hwajinpoensis TaxID=208199 RepID=UPI00325B99EB
MEYLGKAIYQEQSEIQNEIIDWVKITGKRGISSGIPLEDSFRVLTLFRQVSFETALREIQLNSHTVSSSEVSKRIDSIIEEVSYTYNNICIAFRNQENQREILANDRLHISIIPITESLAILPITGSLQSEHADRMMKETLSVCNTQKVSDILVDLSGVLSLDQPMATSLSRMKQALMYSGINMAVCGIQPSIAFSVTAADINLSGVPIFGTLRQALLQRGIRQTKPTL